MINRRHTLAGLLAAAALPVTGLHAQTGGALAFPYYSGEDALQGLYAQHLVEQGGDAQTRRISARLAASVEQLGRLLQSLLDYTRLTLPGGVQARPHAFALRPLLERLIAERGIQRVRVGWCDAHGLLRGKTLMPHAAVRALRQGVGMVGTLMLKDTADRTAWKVFEPGGAADLPGFAGASNLMLMPDPASFTVLPWLERTGWLRCQPWFADGTPVPLDARRVLQTALARLGDAGYGLKTGLEVEFHIYRITDTRPQLDPELAGWPGLPPTVEMIHPGYNLQAEAMIDGVERIVGYQRLGGEADRLVVVYALSVDSVLTGWRTILPLAWGLREPGFAGGKALDRVVAQVLPGGNAAGSGLSKGGLAKGGLTKGLAGAAMARIATRSVPGAIVIGGGLLAKMLYDRRHASAQKPASPDDEDTHAIG